MITAGAEEGHNKIFIIRYDKVCNIERNLRTRIDEIGLQLFAVGSALFGIFTFEYFIDENVRCFIRVVMEV